MPNTRSSYGPDRGITTTMEREPLSLPNVPDFWKTLAEVQRRAPIQQQPAALQARSISGPAPGWQGPPMRESQAQPEYDYEPYFGYLGYEGGSAGHYNAYQPGMPMGTGQQPVAMGYQQRRRV